MVQIEDAYADTPVPGYSWQSGSETFRISAVYSAISDPEVKVVSASAGGRVTVSMPDMPAAETGVAVRALQAALQSSIDPALRVYLEVKGDMNSLHRLRGVEIE